MSMKFFNKTSFDEIIIELTNNLSFEFCKCCIGFYNRKPSNELCEEWIEIFLAKVKTKANKWATDKINRFNFPLNDDTKEELIDELTGKLYFYANCEIWKQFFDDGFDEN